MQLLLHHKVNIELKHVTTLNLVPQIKWMKRQGLVFELTLKDTEE